MDQSGVYRIRIQGRLPEGTRKRFEDTELVVDFKPDGQPFTTLFGVIEDQSALHGILTQIRDISLPLILVELIHPIHDEATGEKENE